MKISDLEHIFTYHAPNPGQAVRYQAIRDAAKAFAVAILQNTQESADQTTAIRRVREAVFVANASIALEVPGTAPNLPAGASERSR